MKNYKKLAPVLMILLFALGVYVMASNNMKANNQYNDYLEQARSFADQKIEVYAMENYQKALDEQPSPELYLEIGTFYRDKMENLNKARDWGKKMLNSFPKDAESYEFQLDVLSRSNDYVAFFTLYESMLAHELSTDVSKKLYEEVEFVFRENGKFDEMSIFNGNMAPIRKNVTWGYCGLDGKEEIKYTYLYAGPFSKGMAPVIDANGDAYFINDKGNKVLSVNAEGPIVALGVMSDADNYAVANEECWNYYTKSGELLMGGFVDAANFANGLGAAKTQEGWKIYDPSGKPITDKIYEEIVMDEKQMVYRNDRLFVRDGSSYYMIDGSGNQITSNTYEDVKIFYDLTYAAVKKNGKWGFIDKDGNWFIEPTYENARSFANGYAAVQQDGLWGFINTDNKLCIPCQYAETKDFTSQGTAPVRTNQTWKVLVLYKNNYNS